MKKAAINLLFLLTVAALFADVPVRREEFIYSILAFNGRDYSGTFCREDGDTIYLLADVDNFITTRKTFVYFWPITGDYKTDTSSFNEPQEGSLELSGPGKQEGAEILTPQKYTYFNVQGEYELNWKVVKDQEAEQAWEHYTSLVDAYWEKTGKYQQDKMLYDMLLSELTKQIGELRQAGKDMSALVEKLKGLAPPQEPQPPTDYVVPPVPVQPAFIINLPEGEYRIRFLTPDGSVMEGTDKKIVTFARRRAEGIAFEVIPADKWTRPVESNTPSSVLYVDGSSDLYLRPFFQLEYNDLYYEKMKKNDSLGNPNLYKWARIQQVPGAGIELMLPGRQVNLVREQPFYVEQTKGSALGYQIVPFDPEGAHKDREPSLRAFQVPIGAETRAVSLRVKDRQGTLLAGGSRQIRVVKTNRSGALLTLLALLPLLALLLVRLGRRRTYAP
jgi:hypothetical protein